MDGKKETIQNERAVYETATGARLITGTAATDFNFNQELASVAKRPADSDKVAANM